MRNAPSWSWVVLLALAFACSDQTARVSSGQATIDASAIIAITGGTSEVSGDVTKINFPRTDVPITIDGVSHVPPFLGLTSYAAFEPLEGDRALMMGDLVLFEDEVSPAMSAALDHGLEVTALHNHFFDAHPSVYFMHVAATAAVSSIATGVKATLDAARSVRAASPTPSASLGKPLSVATSRISAAKLDALFGMKGTSKDGMYKAVFGRNAMSSMCDGCWIGAAMGINTWAAFAGTDDDAVVDGDFAVTEDELQDVLKTLRGGDIAVVAIHSHTMGETPRILFLHYWGRGAAKDLASTVKRAVDQTAWAGRSSGGSTLRNAR